MHSRSNQTGKERRVAFSFQKGEKGRERLHHSEREEDRNWECGFKRLRRSGWSKAIGKLPWWEPA